MTSWIRRWFPAAVLMAFIFLASATPGSQMPEFGFWDGLVKKGGHMIGYGLLAAAYARALNSRGKLKPPLLLLAVCLAVLYGIADEWHQSYTPGRYPSARDVFIDAAGAILGVSLWHRIRTRY